MKNQILKNILKKHKLNEGDKISFNFLQLVCEQEKITLGELTLMLQISNNTIYKLKKNKQKTTKLNFKKYNNTKLKSILKSERIDQKSFEQVRENNQVKTYTLMRLLGISAHQYTKMKRKQLESVRILDIKKKHMVDMIKIDLKYLDGYGSRFYSKEELTEICHAKRIELDDFLKYFNKNIKHYKFNKMIIQKNKNGFWIGETIIMPKEFFDTNEEYMRHRLGRVVDKYNILFSWKPYKEDLIQDGIFELQQKCCSIVNNFSFDIKLLFNILMVKAKYIMLKVFRKNYMEQCISYDAYNNNEIDHMGFLGSEDYEMCTINE